MKKYLSFIFLLFIPFIVNAEVKIKEAVLVDNTEGLEVEKNPHYEGLQLDIDMKLAEVGEFAKYKLTIENDTNKDYEIDMGEAFSDKEYIKYEFSFVGEDNSVLKASESKDIYVTVSYNKEVPETEFKDGVYNDDNVMTINLSNEEQQVNPSTNTGYIILAISVLLVISLVVTLISKHKLDKVMVLIIAAAIIVPISIFALEKITIKIQAKIQIVYAPSQMCIEEYDAATSGDPVLRSKKEYPFNKGSIWSEFIASDYNTSGIGEYERGQGMVTLSPTNVCGLVLTYNERPVMLTDKIVNKKQGCYKFYWDVC